MALKDVSNCSGIQDDDNDEDVTSSLTISATVATEPPRTDPIPIFQLVEKMTARIMAPPNGLLTKAN